MEQQNTLAQFICSEFMIESTPAGFPLEYDLLESGIVDSLGLLKLVSFIEDQMQVSIAPEAMTPDNFRSLGAMLRLLAQAEAPQP